MNELITKGNGLVLPEGIAWRNNGLILPDTLSFDEWLSLGSLLEQMDGAIMWWIGDWAVYGAEKWGDLYAQAVDVHNQTGIPVETIRNAQWVANRIEFVRRRTKLSWGHHAEVASLEREDQDAMLDWALEDKGKSVHMLRAEVRRFKQRKKQAEAAALLSSIDDDEPRVVACADALTIDWPQGANLILADPPYGLSTDQTSGVRDGKGSWDEWEYEHLHYFNARWLAKARAALADEGSLLAFGTLHNTYSIGHLLKEAGAYIIRQIIWHKSFVQRAVNLGALVPAHETILWARFGARHRCNLFEITRDVWEIPTDAPFGHPTEKPEALLRRLIEMASDPGDLVLDIFAGSGTAAATAISLTRKAWAVEQDETWAPIAEARCQQARSLCLSRRVENAN